MSKTELTLIHVVYQVVDEDEYDGERRKYIAAFSTPEAAWGMANSLGLEVEDVPLDTYGSWADSAEEIKSGNSLYRVAIFKNALRKPSVSQDRHRYFLNQVRAYGDYCYVTVWAQNSTAAIAAATALVDEYKQGEANDD